MNTTTDAAQRLHIKVLGSSAGGGFPQWNCNCRNCDGVRHGTIRATRRTQSSIAISANGSDWLLVNASPDILVQIAAHPELQPARRLRDSGIAAVLTIDAQIDHVTGLLMLRERGTPLPLYTTAAVWQDLCAGFPIGLMLSHYCGVEHHEIAIDGSALALPASVSGGGTIRVSAVPLSSKAPPYSRHRDAPECGDTIGLLIENTITDRRALYAPSLGAIEPHVRDAMAHADLLLVDGTLWSADEMIGLGLSAKTAEDMGHLPQSGSGGMIELLDSIEHPGTRRVLIHINNSNPILVEDGPERAMLAAHRIEVAYDGMEFEL